MAAFLLFLVQFMMGKQLLPHFGGNAAVWTTSMVFFMGALLVGYCYAFALTGWVAGRWQWHVHVGIALVGLVVHEWLTRGLQAPMLSGAPPAVLVMLHLARTVGIPYILLAATSPLLQFWLAGVEKRVPYWLYALSNIGSFAALVIYPVAIEPFLSLPAQTLWWRFGWLAAVGLGAVCGVITVSSQARPRLKRSRLPRSPYVMWLLLAALPAGMLIATTEELVRGVAGVPFLWVLPLMVYLLSFVVCFGERRALPATMLVGLGGALFFWYILARVWDTRLGSVIMLSLTPLFLCAMACHGYLYLQRPPRSWLPHFYVMIAAGGVLGGLVVSVGAPLLLTRQWEFILGTLMTSALMAILVRKRHLLWLRELGRWAYPAAVGITVLTLTAGIAQGSSVLMRVRQDSTILEQTRNFYGVLTVLENHAQPAERALLNGRILHGTQIIGQRVPTTYYTTSSGVGLVLAPEATRATSQRRVGVVGLGAGSLAAYCRAGDTFRFYELNPAVSALAQNYFTYLKECPGRVDIVEGDARLSLEQEQGAGAPTFDVLVVDAFSDDAIPIHLLTAEALQLYERRLAPNGILAIHISNSYLDLAPPLKSAAQTAELTGFIVNDEAGDEAWGTSSNWVLLVRQADILAPEIRQGAVPLNSVRDIRPWTDAYSTLFTILK